MSCYISIDLRKNARFDGYFFYFYPMLIDAEHIKKALAQNLPGEAAHRKMLPLNRELKAGETEQSKIKHSSVLLLVFIENNELNMLLIKRPEHMKHHAGQIALPGGRIEKGETALETALRETEEEIGVSSEQIQILGSLSELYVQVSRFQIRPFVGWLAKKPELVINKNEVEKTISFPFIKLKDTIDEVEIKTISGELKVPCIQFEDEIIWGATAMILYEFYETLTRFINKQ
ncbi:MAG TPA: CoA pyrophosphatase [Draconibacterium sp.]|nr:CoA pyrophosphatase [Draconibacterium sp.]